MSKKAANEDVIRLGSGVADGSMKHEDILAWMTSMKYLYSVIVNIAKPQIEYSKKNRNRVYRINK